MKDRYILKKNIVRMKRMFSVSMAVIILFSIFAIAIPAGVLAESPPDALEAIKWQQRPDMEQGLNIVSIANRTDPETIIVADDWLCLDGNPVTDLHFWGSYLEWMKDKSVPTGDTPGVEAFKIQIYSDIPATGTGDFSRPGDLLYEVWVDDFSETYVDSIYLSYGYYEHKYRYDLDLPEPFKQERGKIFWLSISAIPKSGDFPWGWESSRDQWNDIAVQNKHIGPDNWGWEPIYNPWLGEPIDMAFEITTTSYGPIKWLQFPDMDDGINILSISNNPVVADDWLCTDGKPISEVHFWGSYLSPDESTHWQQDISGPPGIPLPPTPGVNKFKLSFHKDVPAGVDPDMPFSHPGELIKEVWVDFREVEEHYWDSIPHVNNQEETWYEHKFYYIIYLDEPFMQDEGTIYWLDIGAEPKEDGEWFWGWETSKDHWHDNAVRGDGLYWRDLGPMIGQPKVDMAFLLSTGPVDCLGECYDNTGVVVATDIPCYDCINILGVSWKPNKDTACFGSTQPYDMYLDYCPECCNGIDDADSDMAIDYPEDGECTCGLDPSEDEPKPAVPELATITLIVVGMISLLGYIKLLRKG